MARWGVGRGGGEKGVDSVCHLEVQLKSLKVIGFEGQVKRWAPDSPHAAGFNSWCHFLRWGRLGNSWVESKLPFEMQQIHESRGDFEPFSSFSDGVWKLSH